MRCSSVSRATSSSRCRWRITCSPIWNFQFSKSKCKKLPYDKDGMASSRIITRVQRHLDRSGEVAIQTTPDHLEPLSEGLKGWDKELASDFNVVQRSRQWNIQWLQLMYSKA